MSEKPKVVPKKKPIEPVVKATPVVKDGVYVDKQGTAHALAKFSREGAKMNTKAVNLAKVAAYIIENGKKRELTTKEASAFVKSGWTNPPK